MTKSAQEWRDILRGQTIAQERLIRHAQRENKRQAKKLADNLKVNEAQLRRIDGPTPAENCCQRCYYLEGKTEQLVPVAHDDPTRFDKLECRTCGFAVERKVN
jgi:hypothetical protein